jgi:GNAT superfamily N-acetyltransferase
MTHSPTDPWLSLARCALGTPGADFLIQRGTRDDLAALSRFHYRAGPPATIDLVLRATDRPTGILAGVLVVSRPTLNGSWRAPAWGEPFNTRDKRALAHALNRSVRCISRVIIDPRFRGLGLARELVLAYLASPLTSRTESPAAMGRFANFFLAAGMRAVPMPHARRDERLLAAITRACSTRRSRFRHGSRIKLSSSTTATPASPLAPLAPPSPAALARRVAHSPALREALLAWAAESRASRPLIARRVHWPTLAAHAARAIAPTRPTVFVWP